jgi:hypothetical protein
MSAAEPLKAAHAHATGVGIWIDGNDLVAEGVGTTRS